MLNFLFILDYFTPHIGGVEKLFESLTKQLTEKGKRVVVVTWQYDRTLALNEEINGVQIIRVKAPSRLLFPILALSTLVKEAKKADLIHTSTYSAAFGAWMAARITKTKIIVTVHEVWGKLWKSMPFLSTMEKLLFQSLERIMFMLKFDSYIAVSHSTSRQLKAIGISSEKVEVIYNGIEYNLPQWSPNENNYTFTYFGRAGVSKGLDTLMEAAKNISENNRDIKFNFIVSPQNTKTLHFVKNALEKSPLKDQNNFFSNLPYTELLQHLTRSDCVIVPSLCEGFGFTAVETCAMGIPIISSGKGSLNEVVSGKYLTFSPYTSKALTQAMQLAIEDKFDETPIKKFTVDQFIENHLKHYKNMLND